MRDGGTISLSIDAVGIKHDGGARVLLDITEAALASDRWARVTVFCSPRSLRKFDLPDSAKLESIEVPEAEHGLLSRAWWQVRGLPRAVSRAGVAALLCLDNGGISCDGIPAATLVQQSLPFSPEALARLPLRGRLRAQAIRWGTRLSCRRADRTIVQTQTMRQWISDGFGIDPARITVIEPAPSLPPPAPHPSAELACMRSVAPGNRLLYVGNSSPYKNLSVLTGATALLRERHVGLTTFLTVPPEHPLCRAPGLVGLGRLDRNALREAYELATALVMPSLVETVGLPMLEAASVGTPVVAADRPYARDVCGAAALYFDPLDARDLAGKLDRLLSDPQLRADLAARGKALASRRAAERPYERMMDLMADLADRREKRHP